MKDPYVVAVGRRLDTTMKVFGIPTARKLAEFLGLERTQVSNWYNGVGLPPVPHAIRLCETFHLILDWIYRGVPEGIPFGVWVRIAAAFNDQPLPEVAHETPSEPEAGPAVAGESEARQPAGSREAARVDAGKAGNG